MKNILKIIIAGIIISGCSNSTNVKYNEITPNANSQEEQFSNEEKALALVSAGCSSGYLENLLIDGADSVMPNFWNGSISKFYIQENNINIFDYEASEEEMGRNSIFQIDIWHSDYIEQSFVMAKTLDPKWNDLYYLWIDSMDYAVSNFRNGSTIGKSSYATYDKYFPSIEPICKLVIAESKNLAQNQNKTIVEWVVQVSGNLLPAQFEKFYE